MHQINNFVKCVKGHPCSLVVFFTLPGWAEKCTNNPGKGINYIYSIWSICMTWRWESCRMSPQLKALEKNLPGEENLLTLWWNTTILSFSEEHTGVHLSEWSVTKGFWQSKILTRHCQVLMFDCFTGNCWRCFTLFRSQAVMKNKKYWNTRILNIEVLMHIHNNRSF